MSDKGLIGTYVRHGDKWWNVSTIDRDSSAIYGGRYSETLVWEWDAEAKKRGALVFEDGYLEGSIRKHQEIVERIHQTGSPEPIGDESDE